MSCSAKAEHPVTTSFDAVLQSQSSGYWIARSSRRSSRAMTPFEALIVGTALSATGALRKLAE
jgi:hypothetical protein